jgi:multidrug efflux pump subunit AcrA (membrane-fusion protein)
MRQWTVIAILVLAGALALYLISVRGSIPFLTSTPALRPGAAPVVVSAAPVQRQDVPIDPTGLDTVQAYNSGPGKSREINFSEGKHMSEGDMVVEIDPRPLEKALSQAEATTLLSAAGQWFDLGHHRSGPGHFVSRHG